jgi:hypothetical protein
MPRFRFCIACAATLVALVSAFAPAAQAELLLVTYTSGYVGTEIFKFDTLDGSGVPGYGDSEISFPLLYDSQGNENIVFAAPGVESNYPGTIIVTCCATGFSDLYRRNDDPRLAARRLRRQLRNIRCRACALGAGGFHLGDDAGGLRRARLRSPATPGKRATQFGLSAASSRS